MNISNEAVEAAVNAFAPPRADRTPHIREQYEKKIRAALEAAAPHLLAHVTTEEELGALPAGSVVMGFDAYGEQLVSRKSEHGTWEQAGTDDGWQAEGIIRDYGSVTVLHRGVMPDAP